MTQVELFDSIHKFVHKNRKRISCFYGYNCILQSDKVIRFQVCEHNC